MASNTPTNIKGNTDTTSRAGRNIKTINYKTMAAKSPSHKMLSQASATVITGKSPSNNKLTTSANGSSMKTALQSKPIARDTPTEKKVDEMPWIKCDYCFRWELYSNTELGVKMGNFDASKLESVEFKCDFCTLMNSLSSLSEKNQLLIEQVDKLTAENTQLKGDLGKLEEKTTKEIRTLSDKIESNATANNKNAMTYSDTVKTINDELTALKNGKMQQDNMPSQVTDTLIRRTGAEIAEIEKRKNNVIVFGLKESDSDKKQFVDFANRFHVLSSLIDEEDIVSAERLGRITAVTDKPRLLRLKFKSPSKRKITLNMH